MIPLLRCLTLLLAMVLGSAAVGVARADDGQATDATAEQLAHGRYLLRIGDCRSCHTRRGGEPFAGDRALPTAFGTFYAPNITPDARTGIGEWSADDFWRALHEGVSRDGHLLYPAFPYDSFTRIRREDSDAMYAALMTLEPVVQESRSPALAFPFNQRWLLRLWRALYFDAGVQPEQADKSPEWNRGAYLVEGLGHCGACHTPRNRMGATLNEYRLGGALIGGQDWHAPNLNTTAGGGLEGWQHQDIVAFLGTGVSARGSAFGPMAEVVRDSLQYLQPADLDAIATYLMDPPAMPPAPRYVRSGMMRNQVNALVEQGSKLYRHQCADCHGDKGEGKGDTYPALTLSGTLRGDPVNAIRMVLLGGFQPSTHANPRPYSMPPFAPTLNDEEVAAVVSYVRRTFGDGASAVSPQMVAEYRSAPIR